MKKIVAFLFIGLVFLSCSKKEGANEARKKQKVKTNEVQIKITEENKQKYFDIYRNMIKLSHKYKNEHEKLKKEIDKLFEENGLTRKEYDKLGLKLIEKDKEYFKKKISEINDEFSNN